MTTKVSQADREELLSEALFRLSDRLRKSGFLDDDENHNAYERVVAAFNTPFASHADLLRRALSNLLRECAEGDQIWSEIEHAIKASGRSPTSFKRAIKEALAALSSGENNNGE